MSDVKWIKIVTDIFDDDKIKLIEAMPDGDTIIVIWFKLLCLAGKQNYHGMLLISDKLAYTDEMLSVVFRRPINTVRLALDAFENFKMIQRTEIGAISITNWEKHQNTDALDKIREKGRIRQANFRERKAIEAAQSYKALEEGRNVTETLPVTLHNVSVTPLDIDIDIDIEKEIDKNIPPLYPPKGEPSRDKKRSDKFIPPTLEEVKQYFLEKNIDLDPEEFFSYYDAANWKRGNTQIKKWKSCVVTWQKRESKRHPSDGAMFTGNSVKVEKNPRGYDPLNGFSEEELDRRKEFYRQIAKERGEL